MKSVLHVLIPPLVLVSAAAFAAADPSNRPSFNRDVRPILSEHCFACHGFDEKTREADLRLDIAESATADRGGVRAITPGDPQESELWRRVTSTDPYEVMPPPDFHKSLSDEEKRTIERWIEHGAEYESHWSFIAPVKPSPPEIEGADSPVDAFLQARLQAEGLAPTAKAAKETLVRRVTLDLTGLPPTPEEVDAFLADSSSDAYERLVDRLQSRPSYGEHMARYWLDLARYADTHGLHLDNERSMWPYRDWVVRAINQNIPFDDFTRWQLAGDLLPDPTEDQRIASGFNRCNVTTSEGGSIQEEWIYRYAVDRTTTMAEVWMGLTAGCAVCHDHKFDPLSTKEYYAMYAFFHSAADPAMDGNVLDTPPALKLIADADQSRIAELIRKIDAIEQRIDTALAKFDYVDPATLEEPPPSQTAEQADKATDPAWSWHVWSHQSERERRKDLPDNLRRQFQGRNVDRWTAAETEQLRQFWLRNIYAGIDGLIGPLKDEKAPLEKEKAEIEKAAPVTLVMADLPTPRESFVMHRGAYDNPGEKVTRDVPAFLPPLPQKPDGERYDRLDLANWLVGGQHPLTARVAVNRYWQQFFGTGLVRTSEDFGTQGELPSHPELLDWLAVQFQEDGWDMKRLVKRIVSSHAYRQSSRVTPELIERDPENRLLARGPRFRLDAEVLRDQALFVSGLLVPTIGGAGAKPYQPPNIWEPVGFGRSNTRYYEQDHGAALYRRSLYTFLKRTAPPPFMASFDAPNREQSCARRGRSNTPMQALQLMNDVQHVEAAREFAQRILDEGGSSDEKRITWAWRAVTARHPDSQELAIVRDALLQHRERYADDEDAAAELVSYGESETTRNTAEPELAAWTLVANLILNLDESVSKN